MKILLLAMLLSVGNHMGYSKTFSQTTFYNDGTEEETPESNSGDKSTLRPPTKKPTFLPWWFLLNQSN